MALSLPEGHPLLVRQARHQRALPDYGEFGGPGIFELMAHLNEVHAYN